MNRSKLLYVSPDFVTQLLSRGLRSPGDYIELPEPIGLPATARVAAIHADYARNAFCLVVEDPTFEIVPDAELIPEIKVSWGVARIALQPDPDPRLDEGWVRQMTDAGCTDEEIDAAATPLRPSTPGA